MREHVVLAFDPYYVDEIHVDVFNDEVARTLYLGIKQQHLVSQKFNQACLDVAAMIKARAPDAWGLYCWLSNAGMIGTEEQDFAGELLPYVLGEKELTWAQASATEMDRGQPNPG